MEQYESKQAAIRRSAEQIYMVLSDFSNFTPILKDKVQKSQADENSCSFSVKGFTAALKIVNKEPFKVIKITGDNTPIDFNFWIQMKELSPDDTRIRLVLHAEMNMMIKMMIGNKIQKALDEMVDQIATSFNSFL